MRRLRVQVCPTLSAVLVLLAGCSEPPSTGTVDFRLADAPYPFAMIAAAHLDVDGVEVHVTARADGESGFHVLADEVGLVDLLELTNGVTASIGRAELPVGEIKQMRLLVSAASVTLDDPERTTFDLDVPSGESSGLKVFFDPPIEVTGGTLTEVIVDADVSRSFSTQPSDPGGLEDITGFRFHPVLRVAVASETGTIAGRVTADADGAPIGGATVSLLDDGAVLTATATTPSGYWTILGVMPGLRTVRVEASGFSPVLATVQVAAGEIATLGDLGLALAPPSPFRP